MITNGIQIAIQVAVDGILESTTPPVPPVNARITDDDEYRITDNGQYRETD
jgi:hypothetical protein